MLFAINESLNYEPVRFVRSAEDLITFISSAPAFCYLTQSPVNLPLAI